MADPIEPPDPRVLLAIERTLLAWTRTSIALMGLGFIVARLHVFLQEPGTAAGNPVWSAWMGTGLVVMGVLVQVMALLDHRKHLERARRNEALMTGPWSSAAVLAVLLGLAGVVLAVYLLVP